jgi:hypothetical protein
VPDLGTLLCAALGADVGRLADHKLAVLEGHAMVREGLLYEHRSGAHGAAVGTFVRVHERANGSAHVAKASLLQAPDHLPQRRERRERDLAVFFTVSLQPKTCST